MKKIIPLALTFCLSVSTVASGFQGLDESAGSDSRASHVPENYELVYEQDFEGEDGLANVACSDKAAWQMTEKDGLKHLDLFQASKYRPTHRSPHNIALFRDGTVENFVMDLKMMQTGREYGHRDLCIFFGFQDAEHFYYVHMATKGDQNAHQVFIVNDAARTPITAKRTSGVDWGTEKWHDVRLVRNAQDGTIEVYFDDMETPIMEASDQTFTSGYVGVGSFDDTGSFDKIKIWGEGWETNPLENFSDLTNRDDD